MKPSENHELIRGFLTGEKPCLNSADGPSGISVLYSPEQEDHVHTWQLLKPDFNSNGIEEFSSQIKFLKALMVQIKLHFPFTHPAGE